MKVRRNPNCLHCTKGSCDSTTGACKECRPGYRGSGCKLKCQRGKYGENCQVRCPINCAHGSTCEHTTGRCTRGCSAGFTGDWCDKPCAKGFYGEDCRSRCHQHCSRGLCDPISGYCLSCERGSYGPFCGNFSSLTLKNSKVETGLSSEEITENTPFVVVASFMGIVAIGVILMFGALGVLLLKDRLVRREERHRGIPAPKWVKRNSIYRGIFANLRSEEMRGDKKRYRRRPSSSRKKKSITSSESSSYSDPKATIKEKLKTERSRYRSKPQFTDIPRIYLHTERDDKNIPVYPPMPAWQGRSTQRQKVELTRSKLTRNAIESSKVAKREAKMLLYAKETSSQRSDPSDSKATPSSADLVKSFLNEELTGSFNSTASKETDTRSSEPSDNTTLTGSRSSSSTLVNGKFITNNRSSHTHLHARSRSENSKTTTSGRDESESESSYSNPTSKRSETVNGRLTAPSGGNVSHAIIKEKLEKILKKQSTRK